MNKYTPGPWSVEARKGETWVCRSDSAVLARIAAAKGSQQANARLIAAAPDLLEALKRLSAQCDRLRMPEQAMTDAEKSAIAAIDKATGANQ